MENAMNDDFNEDNLSDQGTIQEGGTFQTDTYSDAYGQNQSDPFPGSGPDRNAPPLDETLEIPPLSEADTAPMFTDLGLGEEDTYNKAGDEATDTMLFTDTHTAINTAENRSNSLAYEGDLDDLTEEIDENDL
ncbi:hypothetical protein [Larkinella soli]|uniref:hypothetical protein n=1 Tax=Larkinella soli TaxID=1770527 RepID=UPI000FFCA64E|nr:hypothetical protein [Larkinella soli]